MAQTFLNIGGQQVPVGNRPPGATNGLSRGSSPIFLRPPVGSFARGMNEGSYTGSTLAADGGTARHFFSTIKGCTCVQLVFSNYYNISNGESLPVGAPSLIVGATLEYPADTFYPVTFNGKNSATIDPGGIIISDPIAVDIPAAATPGTIFWTRTYVQIPQSTQMPIGPYAGNGPDGTHCGSNYLMLTGAGGTNNDGTDHRTTAGVAWQYKQGVYSYGPMVILGDIPNASLVAIGGILGDSIAFGAGDTPVSDYGYIARTLQANGIPYHAMARASELAANFAGAGRRYRMLQIQACTHIVCEYGTNDIAAGSTLAQIKGFLMSIWKSCAAKGCLVGQTTITPRTNSTDAYVTAANQTAFGGVPAKELIRQQLNAWLRAPYTAGAGNSALFDSAGALSTVFDVAILVEADLTNTLNPTGGVWQVIGGVAPTADGLHPSAAVHLALTNANVINPAFFV